MTLIGMLVWLVLGAIAGWVASYIMQDGGLSLTGNIGVGILGAFIGGWVFSLVGVDDGGIVWTLITAVAGAIILLVVLGSMRKPTRSE